MALDPHAVGTVVGPRTYSWTDRDTLLYALGVGAGLDDLAFVTENSRDLPQRVLPTYAVVACDANRVVSRAGTDLNYGRMVHGAQGVRLFAPLPAKGSIEVTSEISEIQDKGEGRNGVVVMTGRGVDSTTGELIVETTSTIVFRGAGGFGGEPGQSLPAFAVPERTPDAEIHSATREDQALLYRLSGDRNPLHSDPWFATERAGFPRPILHGLATYGVVGRALLAALADDDPARFLGMEARFAAPVFPGEELITSIWRTEDGQAVFVAEAVDAAGERRVVLDAGQAQYR